MIDLVASLGFQDNPRAMRTEPRRQRVLLTSGCAIVGIVLAGLFTWLQPLDNYLLDHWQQDLATLPDDQVRGRVEQIATFGQQGLPPLIAALHSDRKSVARAAALVLDRELAQLATLSAEDSTPSIVQMAAALSKHSAKPGPYSGPASVRLATRLLLWPIDRTMGIGEQLVADCQATIQVAPELPIEDDPIRKPTVLAEVTQPDTSEVENKDESVALLPTDESTTAIVGRPNGSTIVSNSTAGSADPSGSVQSNEPPQFIAIEAPRRMLSSPVESYPLANPSDAPSQSITARPDIGLPQQPRPNPRLLLDLDVMRLIVAADQSLASEAIDELYRRGFQTKHIRLAEILADPNPDVRLRFVQSLPQMSGMDARPWLLWLSQDPDPIVRKAAVAVIATSSDPSLQQRIRELEQEETDDEVLAVVRQVLHSQRGNTVR